MSAALDAALAYAARGWPVFPLHSMRPDGLCSCGRRTEHTFAKHPRTLNGVKDATTDARQVREWWRRWPSANVGIRCGMISGLVVLDIDPRNGGDAGLADLQHDLGKLPETATVITGSGGAHFYFAHPGDAAISNSATLGGYPGVDVKADDGYVVAPPSNHASGRLYEWDAVLDVEDVPLATLPTALRALIPEKGETDRPAYEAGAWDGKLPYRAARLIAMSPRVRARFHRDATGLRDTSSSAVDFALACQLALCGLDPVDIEHSVRASRSNAQLPPRRESYFQLTVGKAVGLAGERDRG